MKKNFATIFNAKLFILDVWVGSQKTSSTYVATTFFHRWARSSWNNAIFIIENRKFKEIIEMRKHRVEFNKHCNLVELTA